MKKAYRFALLGEHLSHSYSVFIQTKLFELKEVEATYELIECGKGELGLWIEKLKQKEYDGFNITIPFKIDILQYLDIIDDRALEIGSVNTVKMINNQVIGFNTDYLGFIDEIRYYKIDVYHKNCYILGTGGASKAIKQAIISLDGKSIFVSRSKKDKNDILDYQDLESLEKLDVVINATPVGMYPLVNDSPLTKEVASKAQVMIDLIYNPQETRLMSYVKESYNGLLMLVAQANHAQNIWFDSARQINYQAVLDYMKVVIFGE